METACLILRGLKANYEAAHHVVIRDDAIDLAAEFADRYITGRFLPDKAIDLMDTACARIKINLSAKPAVLEDRERTIQALERSKKGMDRDRTNGVEVDEEKYQGILKRIDEVTAEAAEVKDRWLKEKEAAGRVVDLRSQIDALGPEDEDRKADLKAQLEEAGKALAELQSAEALIQIEVGPDVVAQVVSDWTGIPTGKMLRDQADIVVHLEERLQDRIKGQDQALAGLAEVIRSAKSGIKNPDSPLGVFLLVGPSGVGKTETAWLWLT